MNEEIKTKSLPVKLSEAEVAIRAQELATAEAQLGDAERRLDDFIEAAKETRRGIENEISGFRALVASKAAIVRDRSETREVPVMEKPDYERGTMDVFRTDTNELVATRGLTAEERQQSLFMRGRKTS